MDQLPINRRDLFAAHALQGLLATNGTNFESVKQGTGKFPDYARVAYQIADAMIAASGTK